ncbi:hypothetical protein [Taklimakanibacter lacteus]|uniref:hypothetical protein n=1 Tax=Taklimakanibacter lacteus TaxID=2268456 RepID=UPI0013C50056
MLRNWMAAGTLSLGMLVTGAIGPAQADTDIDVGVGIGGGYSSPDLHYAYHGGGRISCRQGAHIVRSAGFRRVRPIECNGSEYSYRGFRRNSIFEIRVRSRNGRITDIRRRGGWDGGYDDYDDDY